MQKEKRTWNYAEEKGVWEDRNGGTGLVANIKCATLPEEEDKRIGPSYNLYVKGHIKINTMKNTHIQNI